GREFDAETGLYYYRARYYEPTNGRFLSEDPMGVFGGTDFYIYVENNPITGNDPTGLFTIRNEIVLQFAGDIDTLCGTHSAGACTKAQALLSVICECFGSVWKAKAELRIYGNMFVYDGKWPDKGRF